MPQEWWRWKLARETGWTLAQIDGLSLGDWRSYYQIIDGEARAATAATQEARQAAQTRTRRGRR